MKLYDLSGNEYDKEAIMDLYIETMEEFKRENPTFIGAKFIYAPKKDRENDIMESYFESIRSLHKKYPTFFVGFDLVGQEDKMPPLSSYAKNILSLPSNISSFFHAGETNWFGSIDENLVICLFSNAFQSIPIIYFGTL